MYLNLVLDFVPETVYRVARHFNKAKTIIPIIYVKVKFLSSSSLYESFKVAPTHKSSTMTSFCCRAVISSGVHVSAVSQSGLHSFPRSVSPRHQAPKPACRPRHCRSETVRLWQVSFKNNFCLSCNFSSTSAGLSPVPNIMNIRSHPQNLFVELL